MHVSKQATHFASQLRISALHSGSSLTPHRQPNLACCLRTMETRNDYRSDASEPILVSTQDPSQAPLAPIVAPTAFASGSSSDAGYAGTLALVPHQASNSAHTAPYSARSPPPRPVFSTAPPSMADLFAAVHSMQGSIHIIENSQRNMLRRMQAFEQSLTEIERQVSNLDQRSARNIDELENSTHNAHERITDVQADLRSHRISNELQDMLTQANANVVQLRRRLGHALQVLGTHIADLDDPTQF